MFHQSISIAMFKANILVTVQEKNFVEIIFVFFLQLDACLK